MSVPVQYYQSVIAIETAVTGVLLFQTRFFDTAKDKAEKSLPDPRVRLLMLVILTATVFGALEAIREGGGRWAAILVTVGLAVSILPILLGVGMPVGLLFGWIVALPLRARVRRLLCETEYARARGYTPDTLRLYSTQFDLRTLLLWVVPWAAAVAWLAACDGPFDPRVASNAQFNPLVKLNLVVLFSTVYLGVFALAGSRVRLKR